MNTLPKRCQPGSGCFACPFEDCTLPAGTPTTAEERKLRQRKTTDAKAYYAAHKEKFKAYFKAYYKAHKEEINAKSKAYYLKHRTEILRKRRAVFNGGGGQRTAEGERVDGVPRDSETERRIGSARVPDV